MIGCGSQNRFGRVSCFVAGTLLVVQLSGCTSWQAVEPSPRGTAQAVGEVCTNSVRVTRKEGDRVVVWYPRIDADTLAGYLYADTLREGTVRLPLSEIEALEVRRPDTGKTRALVGALGAAAILTIMLVTLEDFDLGGDSGDDL